MLTGMDGGIRKGEIIEEVVNHATELWIYPEGYKASLGTLKVGLACSCLHFSEIALAWRINGGRQGTRSEETTYWEVRLSLLFYK